MAILDYVVGGVLVWLLIALLLTPFVMWGCPFAFILILLFFIGFFYWYYRSRLSFKPKGPRTSD